MHAAMAFLSVTSFERYNCFRIFNEHSVFVMEYVV